MMTPKAAVFCHNGLGDGIFSLVLSNNLQLNGWQVDTFNNVIGSMQRWFPHLPVHPYPPISELETILHEYEWFFVVHNDTDEFVLRLIQEGKRRFPDQVKVLYIYPSKHIVCEPYYQDAQIDPTLPIAENLSIFCEKILRLPKVTRSNGFIPPPELRHRNNQKRVVIHPTSSRPGKNWTKEKYLELSRHMLDSKLRRSAEPSRVVRSLVIIPIFQMAWILLLANNKMHTDGK
ncbi:MAG: hypothetical protein WC341_16375 [Bacteroidales bacterium]|jgi:hypothetical protein